MLGLSSADAESLVLTIERLPAASGVYPVSLAAFVDGELAGRETLPPPAADGEPLTLRWPLPARARGRAVDVRLAADQRVHEVHAGTSRLAAFRIRRIALVR
jgi:hypothetical protein